jgi:hypothetical protein
MVAGPASIGEFRKAISMPWTRAFPHSVSGYTSTGRTGETDRPVPSGGFVDGDGPKELNFRPFPAGRRDPRRGPLFAKIAATEAYGVPSCTDGRLEVTFLKPFGTRKIFPRGPGQTSDRREGTGHRDEDRDHEKNAENLINDFKGFESIVSDSHRKGKSQPSQIA